MQRYRPEQIIEKYRAIVGDTTDEEFFRRPHHQKTQELWCAGHFALGFEKHIGPCTVLIGDRDEQTDADFVLEWNGESLPFQITEVMEPGRRRGDEYRDGAIPPVRSDDWSRGSEHGPSWVRDAIEKKAKKQYADADKLHLLCYLNFGAWSQKFEDMRIACADVSPKFASVWLLSGNMLCRIHPVLPEYPGWLPITETPRS